MSRRTTVPIVLGLAALALTSCAAPTDEPAKKDIILATTTSTQDSGLLDELIPLFAERTGYRVKTIAVGTGEALAMGRRGDADVVLAHAPTKEKESIAGGFTINRRLIMHNDFVIVGPADDPAAIEGLSEGAEAFRKIASSESLFVSRGDNSGTHFREQLLWNAAELQPEGGWYVESGQGMGATLLIASEKRGYTLSDRGTYLALREKADLELLFWGDPLLLNIYSVMEVNPEKFPKTNNAGARAFGDFLLAPDVQERIRVFGVDRFGEPLFFPDAGKDEATLAG